MLQYAFRIFHIHRTVDEIEAPLNYVYIFDLLWDVKKKDFRTILR